MVVYGMGAGPGAGVFVKEVPPRPSILRGLYPVATAYST
jgi:hypothetical protein